MGGDEVLDRIWQYAGARSDAMRSRLGFEFRAGVREGANAEPRFFFDDGTVRQILEILTTRLPGLAEQVVRQAEKICHHQFDLLGYEGVDYGDEIDWHTDRVHGKTAPRKGFHQVQYLEFVESGDSKITWELNRHQYFLILAKAYHLTGDEKYPAELVRQWQHWHAENPYPIGINWASSLEVAFRSLSWIWTYYLLRAAPVWTGKFRQEWLKALGLSGRHIERYLSTYFSSNTHLLGEAVALFFIGTLCPELAAAERWKRQGWKIVLQEAERQVQPDGLHFEQSTYYHVYALDLFLHARTLASLNGIDVPQRFDRSLENMLDALALLSRAGVPPRLGDDDGGRLFDPARNRVEHLLDPLATGAVLFARGDYKFLSGDIREETVWLLGADAVKKFDDLEECAPSGASTALSAGGVYMMANPEAGEQLLIDAGPQGAATAGHGHADALSISLVTSGRTLLIDPGTCEYVGKGPERQQFRSTGAHNTMQVDDRDHADSKGPFAWANLPKTNVERWVVGERFDLFVGSHNGYERLTDPVVHRRWVCALKSGLYLVRDVAEGAGQHRIEVWWHLSPELTASSGEQPLYLFPDKENGLALLTAEMPGVTRAGIQGFWSPVYGKKEHAPVVRVGGQLSLPAELATLVLPLRAAGVEIGKFTRIQEHSGSGVVSGYCYKTSREEHCFYFSPGQQRWSLGTVGSDAEFVYTGAKAGGDLCVTFCNGSYFESRASRVISCAKSVARCEVIEANGAKLIFSSDKDAIVSVTTLEAIATEFEPVLSVSRPPGYKRAGN